MTNRYVRPVSCAICGGSVIADFDSNQIYCEPIQLTQTPCKAVDIPTYITINPDKWARRRWLKQGGYIQ